LSAAGQPGGVARPLHELGHQARVVEEHPPLLGELHASPAPHQELDAKRLFESLDLLRQSGLRDPQAVCCMAEMTFLGNCDEISELSKLDRHLFTHDQAARDTQRWGGYTCGARSFPRIGTSCPRS